MTPVPDNSSFLFLQTFLKETSEQLRDYRLHTGVADGGRALFSKMQIRWNTGYAMGYAFPLPSMNELSDFYRDSYRSVMGKPRTFDTYITSPNYRAQVRSQVLWVRPFLGEKGDWLDIGAGYGLLLWEAKQHLPGWNFNALEPDRAAREYIEKVATLTTDFDGFWACKSVEPKYDVISISHVLEHLINPWQALLQMYRYLRPGGYLMLEVPNDTKAEMMNPRRTNDLPHLWFYSLAGLVKQVKEAGYEVRRSGEIGLLRPAVNDTFPARVRRFFNRKLKGPLALVQDPSWYIEAPDRCNIRIVARKPS